VALRELGLHAGPRHEPARVLEDLRARLEAEPADDGFAIVARLERRIAALLGKEAALFVPSGAMAQQIAFRVHADARGRRTIAGHPQSQVNVWEHEAYNAVHGLRFEAVGDRHRLVLLEDLQAVGEPLAAVTWELPQRDIGGQLPVWDDLVEQVSWARSAGAGTHMDGARLWEAQPFYERPHAEIAALFDTVYVSLHKALLGVRGAVLAADGATIAAADVWRKRLGGEIPDAWPLALAAEVGLEERLPRMAEFRDHAVAIARAVNADGVAYVEPDPPQTPLFHVHLPVTKEAALRARDEIVAERGVRLFYGARTATDPRASFFEVTIGENGMDFAPDEVAALLRELVERARAVSLGWAR
jgi:threonine aldolase